MTTRALRVGVEDVERWRRLSLGLPARPRELERIRGAHHTGTTPLTDGRQRPNSVSEELTELDWRAAESLGQGKHVAKADEALHPFRGPEVAAVVGGRRPRRWYAWMDAEPVNPGKPGDETLKEWDRDGCGGCGELQLAQLSGHVAKDKRIRFCPLLHAMADADGKVEEAGMDHRARDWPRS